MPKINWNGKECDGWVYENNELKPKINAISQNTWVWDGQHFKPKINATSLNTWDTNGAPIPIIAGKVVLRLF